jgi:hypothetical protein
MRFVFFLLLFTIASYSVFAQPYVDILNIRTLQSPDAGLIRRKNDKNHFQYYNASLTLPIQFKKSGLIVVASPFVENWQIKLPVKTEYFFPTGVGLPITLLVPIRKTKWLINGTFIIRNNAEKMNLPEAWQKGGLVLANYKVNNRLTVKVGLYYNREAFGNFFMPLAGLEYKVDSTLQMWGTLPGSFIIEKKLKPRWYTGLSFKAVTNSYQLFNRKFIQVNDNQLSLFSDIYLSKNIVLNAEAGHSILRRIRLGNTGDGKNYSYSKKINDNYLFRLSVTYRIRR